MNSNRLCCFLSSAVIILFPGCREHTPESRPNILWIQAEDMSPDFSCYGSGEIVTPVVDSLASAGIRFTQAHVTAPVCSASRSALVTGMYQTSIGAHQHRSSRGSEKIFLPDGIQMIPGIFRENGYYTANAGYDYAAKTDYNFVWNTNVYDATPRLKADGSDWDRLFSSRAEEQPWFVQLQLAGGKNRQPAIDEHISPDSVVIPPYYPDTRQFRENRASYLESVLYVDKLVGSVLKALERSGELENTIIFFFTDHGEDNYRHKQYLYDGGTHIPLIMVGPGIPAGEVNRDLVSHIDIPATSLKMAGIRLPEHLEGRPLLAENYVPREYIISARDRCDWTRDRIRSVRTADYKYIRNFHPEFPYMQSQYRDNWPTVIEAKQLFREGKLTGPAARFFDDYRPAEELYHPAGDPHELHNLAGHPDYSEVLEHHRKLLDQWIINSGDHGEVPESEASYLEALVNINTGTPFNHFPLKSTLETLAPTQSENQYRSALRVTNTSNRILNVRLSWELPPGVSLQEPLDTFSAKPGSEVTKALIFNANEAITQDELISLQLSTGYVFPSGDEMGIEREYRLTLPEIYHVPPGQSMAKPHGDLSDWQKQGYSFASAEGDECRFDCRYTDAGLFLSVDVTDNEVVSKTEVMPWMQDGLEIRLDVRTDPTRSSVPATNEFIDHMLFATSPGKTSVPASLYRDAKISVGCPGLLDKGGARIAHTVTSTGHFAEVFVPDRFLTHWGQNPWEAFRLNIIVHDTDNDGSRTRYSWYPDWRDRDQQVVGTGTFFRVKAE